MIEHNDWNYDDGVYCTWVCIFPNKEQRRSMLRPNILMEEGYVFVDDVALPPTAKIKSQNASFVRTGKRGKVDGEILS